MDRSANRRVWADLGNSLPDGICLDAENAIWVACPTASEVIRVKQGGEVVERIKVETDAFACMLGGPDGRTLFVATAPNSDPEKCRATRGGKIETTHSRSAARGTALRATGVSEGRMA